MALRSTSMIAVCFTILLGTFSIASAQPLLFRHRVEADDNTTYWLTDKDGPWLINCASFNGENGFHQANQLVLELRKKHRLNAYIYKRESSDPEWVPGLTWEYYIDEFGQRQLRKQRMHFANPENYSEFAVLVGDFPTIDDHRAEDTLKTIKYLKPEALKFDASEQSNQALARYREFQQIVSPKKEMKEMGPMRQAFLIANPLLPQDYFHQNLYDKLIIDLNRDLDYSLLKCPKPYSVRVATFRGKTTFNIADIEAQERQQQRDQQRFLKLGAKLTDSKLAEADEKASRLTGALRKHGIEAYEFHDRYESYVCVDSFDWVLKKNELGQDVWNPEVAKTVNAYKATTENVGGYSNLVRPKTLPELKGTGITFDAQPLPVQVPRIAPGH